MITVQVGECAPEGVMVLMYVLTGILVLLTLSMTATMTLDLLKDWRKYKRDEK